MFLLEEQNVNCLLLFRHQQQVTTPSRGLRGNQPNVWYNRTAYSQVGSISV